MIGSLQNLRIGMDGRLLHGRGQGASTYAKALQDAQQRIVSEAFILSDAANLHDPAKVRGVRWLRAVLPIGVRTAECLSGEQASQYAPDIFRLAQVWFDIHHRLMPIRIPGRPGIIHWSYPVPLFVRGWQNVYTIHDAIPLTHPRLTKISPQRHGRLLRRIIQQAGRGGALVTVSETARAEIADALHVDSDLITNCGIAVERVDVPETPLPEALSVGSYLLVCGSVERRKNSLTIVEAYHRSGVRLPLVFAGPPGELDGHPDMMRASGIIRLQNPDHATMIALTARARALLMPSLAEGFGLPVVEAMALGTPVLTSPGGALGETSGGAALLVDPTDINALATGIERMAGDAALCSALAAKGRINAENFTAARFASRIAAVYRRLVAGQV